MLSNKAANRSRIVVRDLENPWQEMRGNVQERLRKQNIKTPKGNRYVNVAMSKEKKNEILTRSF